MIGAMAVTIESNGWTINARIKVIGGNRPSIIGRDLMPQFGLQLVQQSPPGDQIMSIDEVDPEPSVPEGEFDWWQTYFSKQFSNLLNRVGKIRNYEVQQNFLKTSSQYNKRDDEFPFHCKKRWMLKLINY